VLERPPRKRRGGVAETLHYIKAGGLEDRYGGSIIVPIERLISFFVFDDIPMD